MGVAVSMSRGNSLQLYNTTHLHRYIAGLTVVVTVLYDYSRQRIYETWWEYPLYPVPSTLKTSFSRAKSAGFRQDLLLVPSLYLDACCYKSQIHHTNSSHIWCMYILNIYEYSLYSNCRQTSVVFCLQLQGTLHDTLHNYFRINMAQDLSLVVSSFDRWYAV